MELDFTECEFSCSVECQWRPSESAGLPAPEPKFAEFKWGEMVLAVPPVPQEDPVCVEAVLVVVWTPALADGVPCTPVPELEG